MVAMAWRGYKIVVYIKGEKDEAWLYCLLIAKLNTYKKVHLQTPLKAHLNFFPVSLGHFMAIVHYLCLRSTFFASFDFFTEDLWLFCSEKFLLQTK